MIQYRLYALAPETAGKPVGFGIGAKERQEKAEIYHVEKKRKKISAEKEKDRKVLKKPRKKLIKKKKELC